MSDVMRDLWPEDIRSEDVISPEEILKVEASRLEDRTGGLLLGHVVKRETEDRVVIGFEVEAPRAGSRVRLFEVQHRLEFEYPAAILPPPERLPDFLRDRVYRHSLGETLGEVLSATSAMQIMMEPGEWIENEWVASSPTEFSQKVEQLLARPAVKAIVLSLLARGSQQRPPRSEEENES